MSGYRRPSPVRATALGASVQVLALLPVFLTGAMAVQLTGELGFGSVGLGLAVAAYRLGGATTSLSLGRLTDRLGAIRTIKLAAAVAAVCTLGIALTADRLSVLVVWLLIGGAGLALAQPGANRLLSNVVPPERLGTAFGFKQSAPPTASLLAGVAVPLIAVTIGWRWAFGAAGVAAVIILMSTRTPPPSPERAQRTSGQAQQGPLRNRAEITLLTVGFGIGSAASSSLTTFYVVSATAAGATPSMAGAVLAGASIAAVISRISTGVLSDRMQGDNYFGLCAVLIGSGSVGIAMLATSSTLWMPVGFVIALMGSWGFNGVFWASLVRSYPESPGRITGAVFPGGLVGSMLGPLVVGLIIDARSFTAAWLTVTVMGVLATAIFVVVGGRLQRLARRDDL